MDKFVWLINWFQKHCNGYWEIFHIIKIETLNNQGWRISINLEKTKLENKIFNKLKIYRDKNNWCYCFIKKKHFNINCSLMNLEEGLKIFQIWTEENEKKNNNMKNLKWLINWFKNHCNGEWEYFNKISIYSVSKPGWKMSISFEDTELERKENEQYKIIRTDSDWCHCYIIDNCFKIFCGLMNLEEGINIFRKWVEK